MNRAVMVLAFLVPAALAGVVVFLVFQRPAASGLDYASKSEVRALREKTDKLDERVVELLGEIRDLRSSLPSAVPTPVQSEAAPEVEHLEDRLGQLETALTRNGSVDDEELLAFAAPTKDRIKTIMDEVREEEREAERQRRREREEEQIRKRVEDMAERLRLSGGQSDEMIRILLAESEARRSIFSDRRGDPGDTDEDGLSVFDKMARSREEKDEALKETLDAWQYDEYKKIEEEQNPWRRRGGRGGDNNGGGDRGGRRGGGRG